MRTKVGRALELNKHGQERPKTRVAETKQRPGPASIGVRTGRAVAADGPAARCQLIPQFKPKQPLGLVGVGVLEDLARVAVKKRGNSWEKTGKTGGNVEKNGKKRSPGVPRAALAVALRDAVALLRVPVARAKVHPAQHIHSRQPSTVLGPQPHRCDQALRARRAQPTPEAAQLTGQPLRYSWEGWAPHPSQ